VVGLDIAGIDMVAEDIRKPLHVQGGAIVEVNAGPGLLMHLKPAVGMPRPVGRAIVDQLFREGEDGRIPIVGVAGTRNTAAIARLVAWLLQLSGRHVGLACRDGLFLERRRVEPGDATRWDTAQRLLMSRSVDTAVIENGPVEMLRDGLAYDRCDVGIVTDLDLPETLRESLAQNDFFEPDQLVKVLRTQVDVVLSHGFAVLNAADERVAAMAELCDGEAILYAVDSQRDTVVKHRGTGARGGRAVFVRDGRVVLATGSAETRLAPVLRMALARGASQNPIDTEVLLAAIAAAWALDVPPDLMIAGIETFAAEPAAA
jgi:cyanophycin synthetase